MQEHRKAFPSAPETGRAVFCGHGRRREARTAQGVAHPSEGEGSTEKKSLKAFFFQKKKREKGTVSDRDPINDTAFTQFYQRSIPYFSGTVKGTNHKKSLQFGNLRGMAVIFARKKTASETETVL